MNGVAVIDRVTIDCIFSGIAGKQTVREAHGKCG